MLRIRGPLTRADLIELTGLSRPTVSSALTEMATSELVLEELSASIRPAGGRPASLFRLGRRAGLAIGVDIGRRHIHISAADLGHTVLFDKNIPLDLDADEYPMQAMDLAVLEIDAALSVIGADRDEVVGVGLGIPAPVTRDGRIGSPALLPAWADLIPEQELRSRLDLPVRVDNDANLGALGEHVWGAGRDCSDLMFVKVATGIGSGIVLDGRLYRGAVGTAGEIGHVTLDARGAVCRCGNRGCVELAAGGRALLDHARASHPDIRGLRDLAQRAIGGDPGCRRLLIDASRQLGYALGGVLNLINPGRIIIGGELAGAIGIMLDPLRQGLAETAMAAAVEAVEVIPSQLGERAAAYGGLALTLGVDLS